jgi:tetratricopeptide (TPR) repeat protein
LTIKVTKHAGSDEAATLLLSLPWELIHDEQGYLFEGKHGIRVRRRLPRGKSYPAVATEPPIHVLLVSPRPEDESAGYIDHRASARPLVEALSQLGELAEFKLLTPPTFPALEQELQRGNYHVVHFDGHGVYDRQHGLGALCFEDPADSGKVDKRRSQLIKADQIAAIIKDHRVPLFFLDACQTSKAGDDPSSSVAGKLLESGVASVAAMSHSVLVETTRRFVSVFYPELMTGQRVGQAMLAAQRSLKNDSFRGRVFTGELHLQDWFVPVLFQEKQDPQLIREVPASQVQAILAKQRELAIGDVPGEPKHGFVGRSRELLKAERMLEHERYVVLLGDGGEGKTTLASELARWLVFTRRFQRAAFVSLESDDDATKALSAIGRQLVPNYLSRAGQKPEDAFKLMERALTDHTTLIVLDNMETVLPLPETLLQLFTILGKFGSTRLIFTSRERLPEPFAGYVQRVGRLDRPDAIRLVGQVLGEGKLMPHTKDAGESEEEIEKLVDAVGCHARALELLAREVAESGVRNATGKIHELMAALETKHPGERERSLLASVELSLRRLPEVTRRMIRPLGVFQGGGSMPAIAVALKIEKDELLALTQWLVGVGLAEDAGFSYLRFDPALAPALLAEMNEEEKETARTAWANTMAAMVDFLRGQQSTDASLSGNLTLLELPNLLAALDYVRERESPERVVDLATSLESLIVVLKRQKALERVVDIRKKVGQQLRSWGRARFEAERSALEMLIEEGRQREAVDAAGALLKAATVAGEKAYDGAAYDLAGAHFMLGRALQRSGAAEDALPHLDEARSRFLWLDKSSMANKALLDKADCLVDLGRYEDATKSYEEVIATADKLRDRRTVAVGKCQLATVRLLQAQYTEALNLYREVREIFQQLGEPGSVASIWHQIAMVHYNAGQYEAAERASQESLKINVQIDNRSGQGLTLNQLGVLYARIGRSEDAVAFYRQAADAYEALEDLSHEGACRHNLGGELLKLRRYDEARIALVRAIECKRPFGHAATPWNAFARLSDLERAVGNEQAARQARSQATQAYFAYRRDGGESQTPAGQLRALVAQQPDAAKADLTRLLQDPDLTDDLRVFIPYLQAVLVGSRDITLADDPKLYYADAVELLLLIESLSAKK